MAFLKTRPFVRQNNSVFTGVSSFTSLLMCITHFTLSCRILPFSLPTTNNFFKFEYSEITGESAWRVLFRLPSLATEGHQNWTHYDSGLLISRTFLARAGSLPPPPLFFFFVFNVLYTKNSLKKHSLADTVPLFSTILQFSSELSKNWGIGLPCLRPFWIYCTGQRRVCFPVFPPFVYNCCIMDHTYHSHKSCRSTLAQLRHHSSWMLTSLFQAHAFPI